MPCDIELGVLQEDIMCYPLDVLNMFISWTLQKRRLKCLGYCKMQTFFSAVSRPAQVSIYDLFVSSSIEAT